MFDNANTGSILSISDIEQTRESGYLQNDEALKYLKEKQDFWKNLAKISAGVASGGAVISNPIVGLGGAIGSLKAIDESLTIDRLVSITEMLLNTFRDEGIVLTPRVKTNEGMIDLFVKTSDGRNFAFLLRSKGTARVKWREDRQDFCIYSQQKNGRTRIEKWSELVRVGRQLNQATLLLKKEKDPIKGQNGGELRKPVTKAIVLTGKTIVDPNNDPALFLDFGLLKQESKAVIRVLIGTAIHLVSHENLVNFLRQPESN